LGDGGSQPAVEECPPRRSSLRDASFRDLLAARILANSAGIVEPGGQLTSLVVFFMTAWTPFISTRLHQMQRELSRAQDLGSYHLETMLGRGVWGRYGAPVTSFCGAMPP